MSPAHCYYDTMPAIETVIPLYYTNATAQIGRHGPCPRVSIIE